VLDIDPLIEINVEGQEEIGSMYCTLAEIVGSPGGNFSNSLVKSNSKECGILSINSVGDEEGSKQFLFNISASNLDHFMGLLDRLIF
jgi:hypothetical protein